MRLRRLGSEEVLGMEGLGVDGELRRLEDEEPQQQNHRRVERDRQREPSRITAEAAGGAA